MFSRPTFKRIVRNKSTEQFSGLPYIYALLNCLICLWYGMPIVSPNIILVATVNSIGAFFQLIYLSIYIAFAGKAIKVSITLHLFLPGNLQAFSIIQHDYLTVPWIFLAAEDVRFVNSSFCHFWDHGICKHEIFWLSWETNFCWLFECCFTHYHVCFTFVYHCKFLWNNFTQFWFYFGHLLPPHMVSYVMPEFGD